MVNIAYFEKFINIRGTSVALFDYASNHKKFYNSIPYIFYCKDDSTGQSDKEVLVKKFHKEFGVDKCIQLDGVKELNSKILEIGIDIIYFIKYGKLDEFITDTVPSCIHCVFDMSEPHGDIYIAVSKNIADKYNKRGEHNYIEHMVSLSPSKNGENFREELNIPKDATVFGRYGGMDTFYNSFVIESIKKIVEERKDIFFLFANTPKYFDNENVKYVDTVLTEDEKNKFIMTCDCHLECGLMGHSFGLACAENSVNNIPILLYDSENLMNRAHIDIIKDKGIYFKNKEEFYSTIINFKKEDYIDKDLNCYKKYSPEMITKQFHTKVVLPLLIKKYKSLI